MSRRLEVAVAWILLGLVLASWALGLIFDQHSHEVTTTLDKLWAVSFLAFPAVGVFLVTRIPTNPVGWLFLIGPLGVGAGVTMNEAGEAHHLSGLIWWGDMFFVFGLLALFSSILLFPDGRYPQRLWGRFHALSLLMVPIGFVLFPRGEGFFLGANLLLPVAALGWRMVTGGSTTRRQIASPVVVTFVGLIVLLSPSLLPIDPDGVVRDAIVVGGTVLLTVGIPVAIAVSITRYRLYEIDRIVSRTVSYGILTAVLAGVYVGLVFVLRDLLPFHGGLPVAASTLIVAALFNPFRRQVQSLVDRRFNRARYDSIRVVEEVATRLREQVELPTVTAELITAARTALQPSFASVWLRGNR